MTAYCPDAGDIIWLDFLQAVAKRRPDGGLRLCFHQLSSMN
ncbi:hypothetical protein [Bradyrhizobium sp.]